MRQSLDARDFSGRMFFDLHVLARKISTGDDYERASRYFVGRAGVYQSAQRYVGVPVYFCHIFLHPLRTFYHDRSRYFVLTPGMIRRFVFKNHISKRGMVFLQKKPRTFRSGALVVSFSIFLFFPVESLPHLSRFFACGRSRIAYLLYGCTIAFCDMAADISVPHMFLDSPDISHAEPPLRFIGSEKN